MTWTKYLYFITVIYKFISQRLLISKYFLFVKEAVKGLLLTAKEYGVKDFWSSE